TGCCRPAATPRSPALARSRSRRASPPPRKKSSLLPCPSQDRSTDNECTWLVIKSPQKICGRPTGRSRPPRLTHRTLRTSAPSRRLWHRFCLGSPPMTEGRTILGRSAAVRRLVDRIERVAPTEATVLIQGERGTGKELVAVAIHEASRRRRQPYVTLNCAALPDELLASELFGRLAEVVVSVPPLRDRREDIAGLAEHFVALYARRHGVAVHGLTSQARRALVAHDWPGNVRELEKAISRGVIFAERGWIDADALELLAADGAREATSPDERAGFDADPRLRRL